MVNRGVVEHDHTAALAILDETVGLDVQYTAFGAGTPVPDVPELRVLAGQTGDLVPVSRIRPNGLPWAVQHVWVTAGETNARPEGDVT